MGPRGLGHVLDQYVDPPRRHAAARAIARVFVPLLPGDAEAAGIVAALAEAVRANGGACSLGARDPRGAALLPPCALSSDGSAVLALELGVAPRDSPADALLLLLLPGWEGRAALAEAAQRPGSPVPVLLIGVGGASGGREPGWSVAGRGPPPICLGQLPPDAGLLGALGLGRAASRRAFEAIAHRLFALAYLR